MASPRASPPTKLAGFDLLRQRLSVYFGEDDEPAWYEGAVDDYEHDKTSSHFAWHRVVFDDGEKRWLDLHKEAANNLLRWAGGAWPAAAERVGRSRRAAGGQLASIVTTELAAKPTPAAEPPLAAKPMPAVKATPAAKPTLAAKLKREVVDGTPARRTKLPRARHDQAEEDGEVDGEVDEVGEIAEMSEDEEDEDWAPEEGEGKKEAEGEDTDEDAEAKAAGPVQVSR